MVRISNSIGAVLMLLIGVGFSGFVTPVFHDWISTAFTGDLQILFIVANIGLAVFLTLILPALIATQDATENA